MRSPYELDKTLGLEYFITSTPGVGGKLRYKLQDFYVEEIPPSNIKARPEDKGYIHFTMEKLNWDTLQAIQAIAKAVGVSPKRFGYAGNKDKRALTRQRISVFGVEEDKLREVSIQGIQLYDFTPADRPIILGDLSGNKFRITARLVEDEELMEKLTATKEELKSKGAPNYFGYQRFGIIRANTHLVGRELVRGRIKEAVMKYIGYPFPGEKKDAREARAYFDETLDYEEALKRFPTRLRYERVMLRHLAKNPRDYAGALRRLPKKLGILFVHAYQSYLFNRVLSRAIEAELDLRRVRLSLFGFDTALGDDPLSELEKEVLEEEGITLRNFWIKSIPELGTRGFQRDACIQTRVDLAVKEDVLNPGKKSFTASFILPKGSYATVVMREFMKADPLNY